MLQNVPTSDEFGDRFELSRLPLPRPAVGYAVQKLDTDTLLDRLSGQFLPIRTPGLAAAFDSFDAAHAAAFAWRQAHAGQTDDAALAIVPLGYDPLLQRPILIYGVLCRQP